MLGVDVGQLNGDEIVDHNVSGRETGPQQVGHDVDDLFVKAGKT